MSYIAIFQFLCGKYKQISKQKCCVRNPLITIVAVVPQGRSRGPVAHLQVGKTAT